METRRIFYLLLLITCFISFTQCEKIEDPDDAITLNMLNEENGKTYLGPTDIYINKANNFKSNSFILVDFGEKSGLSLTEESKLENTAQEIAVIPKHLYYAYNIYDIYPFPSGKRAVFIDSEFFKVHVISPNVEENNLLGAIVKYVTGKPLKNGLPEANTYIGRVDFSGDEIHYTVPKNAEYVFYSHLGQAYKKFFDIDLMDNKLTIKLRKNVNQFEGPYGNYTIYLRSGYTYTKLKFNVGMDD